MYNVYTGTKKGADSAPYLTPSGVKIAFNYFAWDVIMPVLNIEK